MVGVVWHKSPLGLEGILFGRVIYYRSVNLSTNSRLKVQDNKLNKEVCSQRLFTTMIKSLEISQQPTITKRHHWFEFRPYPSPRVFCSLSSDWWLRCKCLKGREFKNSQALNWLFSKITALFFHIPMYWSIYVLTKWTQKWSSATKSGCFATGKQSFKKRWAFLWTLSQNKLEKLSKSALGNRQCCVRQSAMQRLGKLALHPTLQSQEGRRRMQYAFLGRLKSRVRPAPRMHLAKKGRVKVG